MKTQALFRNDAYLRTCEARIAHKDEHGLMLDRTVFYPRSGGQAGDSGWLTFTDGSRLRIAGAQKAAYDGAGPDDVLHIPEAGQATLLEQALVDQVVLAEIDWDRRYRHMRLHTATHLLCAVLPYPVDGCSITSEYARLDFVTNDPLDRQNIDARLAALIAGHTDVLIDTISDEELESNQELVRTMSVAPPKGTGQVRLVKIPGVDIQPCGGTHVANVSEVGMVHVAKIEKKTARTRRVVLALG